MSKDMKLIMERFRKGLNEIGMQDAGSNAPLPGQASDELEAQKVDPKELVPALKDMLLPLVGAGLKIIKKAGIGIKGFMDFMMDGFADIVKSVIKSIDDSTYEAFRTALMIVFASVASLGTAGLAAASIPITGVGLVILATAAGMSSFFGGLYTADTIASALRNWSKSGDSRGAAAAEINNELDQASISFKKAAISKVGVKK